MYEEPARAVPSGNRRVPASVPSIRTEEEGEEQNSGERYFVWIGV
jgi:hypothetical protein